MNDVHFARDTFFLNKKQPADQNRDNDDWRTELGVIRITKSMNRRCRILQIADSPRPKFHIRKFAILDKKSIENQRQLKENLLMSWVLV